MAKKILIKFDNNSHVVCEIAVSRQDKAEGLKKYPQLDKNEGLLFIYEESISPLMFWNKGVQFDIAVAFFNTDLKITEINFLKKDSTDMAICMKPTKYVLELDQQTVKDLKLNVGSQMVNFEGL